MRRALVIAGVMLAGLLALAPTAGAAVRRSGAVFYLHAAGFFVEGRSPLGSDRVRLVLYHRGEVAYYYVPARLGDGTVRARFGRLGTLDLRFRPGRGEGPLGCPASGSWQEGTFAGSLIFRGEHDYADVDADRARGWFEAPPRRGCPADAHDERAVPAAASELGPVAETGVELVSRTGYRKPFRAFYAYTQNRRKGVRTAFEAIREERREGMLIERGAAVYGGAAAFEWDLGSGTARLEPPAPFSGRAFYRQDADGGRPSWTGSLRAPVLGGRPMRMTGGAFKALLAQGSPFN